LDHPDAALLDRNRDLAREHFSLDRVRRELLGVLSTLGTG
jgi:hypothetical protein